MKKLLAYVSLALAVACTGGYSFTGGDVGNAKTVSVDFFPNYAPLVQPNLSQTFTEALRDILVQQTTLTLVTDNADLQFEGSIVGYDVAPINAQANELAAQSRLTITVNVIYTNNLEKEKSFEQRFSRFQDFPADQDISSVEETLIAEINKELAENILNRAIANW